MCVVMLRLPLTSVLLATLLLLPDGPTVMPLVIVAVTVGPRRRPRRGTPTEPSPAPPAPTPTAS